MELDTAPLIVYCTYSQSYRLPRLGRFWHLSPVGDRSGKVTFDQFGHPASLASFLGHESAFRLISRPGQRGVASRVRTALPPSAGNSSPIAAFQKAVVETTFTRVKMRPIAIRRRADPMFHANGDVVVFGASRTHGVSNATRYANSRNASRCERHEAL